MRRRFFTLLLSLAVACCTTKPHAVADLEPADPVAAAPNEVPASIAKPTLPIPIPETIYTENMQWVYQQIKAQAEVSKTVTLYIKSRGGNIQEGFRTLDLMNELRASKGTRFVCIGDQEVASTAFFIFEQCDVRLAVDTSDTEFLTHEPWTTLTGNRHVLEAAAKSLAETATIQATLLAPRIHMPIYDLIEKLKQGDWVMKDDAALKAGWFDDYTPMPSAIMQAPKAKITKGITVCKDI